MIFRIHPTKDSFISNVRVLAVPQTGSNYGHAESLEVFKIAGISGAQGISSGSQLARALLYFSTASLDNFLSNNSITTRFRTYHLRMQHETTPDGLPESYQLVISPVSGAWDEGRGMDTDEHKDHGYTNWWKRTSTQYWVSRGGDVYATPRVVQSFDSGLENIDSDTTSLFEAWGSGTIPNDGLMVALTASLESDSWYEDLYKKSFYSRHSQWPDRRPYVEVRWNDFVGDDRGRMRWNKTGSVYLHNVVNGQYANLSIGNNALIVRVKDASGTLMSVTASHTGMVGIYSASFALPTGSYSGSIFYDAWGSGSFAFMTGTFVISREGPLSAAPRTDYVANISNLRDEYDPQEVPRFNAFIRQRGYRASVVQTASHVSTPDIVERCFYSIENESTRESIVPFGTGSQEHTRLSYDVDGNYFRFPISNLHSGEVYRVVLYIDSAGRRQVIDTKAKFRVR